MKLERAAMQQALEALENAYENGFLTGITGLKTIDTITVMREALAEQADGEQWSPDDMAYRPSGLSMMQTDREVLKNLVRDMRIDVELKQKVYAALAEQAEQEPIYISESCAERGCACHYSVAVDGEPVTVYAAPVRTKDLTDDEIAEACGWKFGQPMYEWVIGLARAVIAADREKNK